MRILVTAHRYDVSFPQYKGMVLFLMYNFLSYLITLGTSLNYLLLKSYRVHYKISQCIKLGGAGNNNLFNIGGYGVSLPLSRGYTVGR